MSAQHTPATNQAEEMERLVEVAIKADPSRAHRDYRLNPIYEEEREQYRPAVAAILAATNQVGKLDANAVEIANQAVKANQKTDGTAKYESAQGFACALEAVHLTKAAIATQLTTSAVKS